MKDKEMPICVDCIHSYVCEEYNLSRDMLRKQCAYHNDHFLDTTNSVVLPRAEYERLLACEHNLKETVKNDFYTIIKALEKRKETAHSFYGVSESVGVDMAIKTVKELVKQFGVEIKE